MRAHLTDPAHRHPNEGKTESCGPAYSSPMAPKRQNRGGQDELLTSPTAARIAGLERVYFARLIREGKGPRHDRVVAGSRTLVLIRRGDLEAWMAERNA
jgi:hypothetical protein